MGGSQRRKAPPSRSRPVVGARYQPTVVRTASATAAMLPRRAASARKRRPSVYATKPPCRGLPAPHQGSAMPPHGQEAAIIHVMSVGEDTAQLLGRVPLF